MKKKEQEVQVLDYLAPDTSELESQILADLALNSSAFLDIQPLIHPDFFTSEPRRKMWEWMLESETIGRQITPEGLLADFGKDFVEVYTVKDDFAGSINLTRDRAVRLRNLAAKRRAYQAVVAFMNTVCESTSSEVDLFAGLEALNRATVGPSPLNTEKEIPDLFLDVISDLKRIREAKEKGETIRISTGFQCIDTILNGGFKPGQLIILAARPSVGKTALMLQLARAAAENNHPATIFSLEMTAQELMERLIFSTGHVKTYELSQGTVSDQQIEKARLELEGLPIHINDESASLDDIVSRLSLAVHKGRCKIAFIDYLGLMSEALNFGNAKLYQAIARITGTLKRVAKRLQIPIVLLCQLNREQAREGRSPELFDLRDSGSIEQDADVVLMLEQNYTDKAGRTFPLVAWLRKNRGGKKEYGFTFTPNATYSYFYESNPLVPESELVEEEPEPAKDLPANVNGLDDDDELPF